MEITKDNNDFNNQIRVFSHFMKANGIYTQWRRYARQCNLVNLNKYKSTFRDIIDISVIWDATKEGYHFWELIDKNWMSVYDRYFGCYREKYYER